MTALGLEVGPPPVKLESGFQRMPEGSVKGEALPASIRMGVKTGAAAMEKGSEVVVPAEVETETLEVPSAALAAMAKVAVIWEELTTTTLLTEMSGLEEATEAPGRKLEPLMVTGRVLPWRPEEGLREEMAGTAVVMAKGRGELDPLVVETVTLKLPRAAVGAMAKVAVIWEELTTTTLLTEISGEEEATEAPGRKLEPLMVTGRVLPWRAEEGLREERVGRGAPMEKV